MAIFCLSNNLQDLENKIGNITIAYTKDKKPVYAKDLKALEVAGASDDLKQKLFSGTAYGVQDAYDMYMYERERGVSPLEAYRSIWSMSNSESLQG